MTACLNAKISNTGKTGVLINECKKLNIQVCPPDINKSLKYYTPDKIERKILYGLNPVKGVGGEASNFIIENRPYNNLKEFLQKMTIKDSPVNKTAIISLIKSGALPTKNKNKTLLKYADFLYEEPIYKDVKSLPTLKKLKEDFKIEL